ncbi:MAG: ABC transporter ATP-binding protein/permease [Clostridiales bacterium]|jgi:ATP-binding cassette subfamily B protein|nr:ABC transporter ATP-binding protein/permease [Clostridiales bacterium]
MLKLLRKFGRPFLGLFFVAVVLLIGRATMELTLPALMSDIVDVGIGQGGIDYLVPTQMTPENRARLDAMLPEGATEEYIAAALAEMYYGSPDFDPRVKNQLATRFIREEYARLGVDTDALQMNYVWTMGRTMIIITLLAVTAAVTQGFVSARIATGMARNIRKSIFAKVTGFNNAEYNQFSTASLITRSTNDVNQVQALMAMAVRIIIFSPIMGIGGVLMVLGTDASMAWVIALAVGAIVTFIILFIIIATPKFKIMQKLIDKVNLVTREGLTGIMVIRAFTAQAHETARFDEVNTKLRRTQLFLARLGALQMPIISLIMGLAYVLIIWIGGASINEGNLMVGDMMAFITYTMFIVWSFLMLAMVAIMLPRAQVAAGRILEIINTEQKILDPENPADLDTNRGDISFEGVSFKFPEAVGYALKDISFTAKSGEMTAIVGSTGSGKTSLVNLIPRFYDTTAGRVLVNGADVRNVTQKALRDLIGYVPQKALLFSGTIESNIQYAGDVDAEAAAVAARIAQAEGFINEKPGKYEEEISQGGTNVSGGQRQRLAIARAIAKNPKIYIFDDSFSALDYKTDAALRAAIKDELSGATMIVVASRINTIKNADKIIVLDEGRVVGQGRHEELLKTCDVYIQIANSQLSTHELAERGGA